MSGSVRVNRVGHRPVTHHGVNTLEIQPERLLILRQDAASTVYYPKTTWITYEILNGAPTR